jgi:2-dehydro-3-deoxyphosphogalactonate aldolase
MDAYRSAGADGFGIGSSLYKPGMSAAEVGDKALDFKAAWTHTMRA